MPDNFQECLVIQIPQILSLMNPQKRLKKSKLQEGKNSINPFLFPNNDDNNYKLKGTEVRPNEMYEKEVIKDADGRE